MNKNLTQPISRTTIFTEKIDESLFFWKNLLGFNIIIEASIPNPGASQIIGFGCESLNVTVLSSNNSSIGNIGLAEIINPHITLNRKPNTNNIIFGETCIVIRTDNLREILKSLQKFNSNIISLPTKLELPIDDEVWEMFVRDPNGVLVNLSHHGEWKE
jgi:Lactoylglutathione lyase and related lyases